MHVCASLIWSADVGTNRAVHADQFDLVWQTFDLIWHWRWYICGQTHIGYCGVNPLFALFCCTIPPQKSAHMFLLYYTPCGLRGHCTTNTVHDNGEYPLLLQGGFSTVGTHADVVLYPLKFEGVLYNEHSAWQWRIPPYLALPGFGQVSLVRLGIINMLPGNTKWGGILRFFRKRSWAFYPLESKCHRAI